MPEWLTRPVTPPARMPRLQPSRVFEAMEMKEGIEAPDGLSALEAHRQAEAYPLERGRLLHRLLELLPDLPEAERAAAGRRFVETSLPARFAARKDELLGEVMAILEDPDLAPCLPPAGGRRCPSPAIW
ncbi:hypothetical protein V6L77_13335 [Pannonibacter sp. Pt2-lr]